MEFGNMCIGLVCGFTGLNLEDLFDQTIQHGAIYSPATKV